MMLLEYLLVFIIGCVAYRIRGGWDPLPIHGTQAARMFFCIPTGFLVFYATMSYQLGLIAFFMSFLGLMIPHGFGMIIPLVENKLDMVVRFVGMGLVGAVRSLLIVLPYLLISWEPLWILLTGLIHSILYVICWYLPMKETWRSDKYPIDASPAWAELFWGGVQFVSILATIRFVGGDPWSVLQNIIF